MKLIDLTHTLIEGIPSFDLGCGFKKILNLDYADYPGEVKFRDQHIACFAGIGTHMDAPSHCIPGAISIADIPLEQLVRPCVVIDVSKKMHESYKLSLEDIQSFEKEYGQIEKNTFVIIRTGWCKYWSEPEKYRNNLNFPSISAAAAELFIERDIAGLGIDTLSPDAGGVHYPVHKIILGAGKYIVENIAHAEQLPAIGAKIFALPLKIAEGAESPIRLIAIINFA